MTRGTIVEWRLFLLLLLAGIVGAAHGQEWIGPFNHTGDTLIAGHMRVAIEDADDNLHLIFVLGDSSLPPHANLFHAKFSPQGEMLISPHQVTFNGWGAVWTGIFSRDVPYLDATFLQPTGSQGGWTALVLRLDYDGNVVEALQPLLDLPQEIGPYESWSVSMDSQFRYHILYGTYSQLWPAVVYARVSRTGDLQIGPDTIAYEQPYYHMRFASVIGHDDQFYGVYSNVDGWDQYLQAVVIDSGGTVLVPPFNPLPDTTHMGVGQCKITVGPEGQVVLFYPFNPPGPVGSRIELIRFDPMFSFMDCTMVEDTQVAYGPATGFIGFDGNEQNRLLSTWETAVQTGPYDWEARLYTVAHDYDLNALGPRDSMDVANFDDLGDLTPVCASGFEALWMDGSTWVLPSGQLYSWFRIVDPDCLSAVGPRPARAQVTPQVTLWPNPTPGMATLSFAGPQSGTVRLDLYNLLGQKVGNWSIDGEANTRAVRLDESLAALSSGTYFLHYTFAQTRGIIRIILNK